MALVTKRGGRTTTNSEQTGTTVTSIALGAPGVGFANRIRAIIATQRGGTSVNMIVNMTHSAAAAPGDNVGVNVNLANVGRTAGANNASNFSEVYGDNGPCGGSNQQTTINVNGNVNDSAETHLVVIADIVKLPA